MVRSVHCASAFLRTLAEMLYAHSLLHHRHSTQKSCAYRLRFNTVNDLIVSRTLSGTGLVLEAKHVAVRNAAAVGLLSVPAFVLKKDLPLLPRCLCTSSTDVNIEEGK